MKNLHAAASQAHRLGQREHKLYIIVKRKETNHSAEPSRKRHGLPGWWGSLIIRCCFLERVSHGDTFNGVDDCTLDELSSVLGLGEEFGGGDSVLSCS